MTLRHNHLSRQLRVRGACPACDVYWRTHGRNNRLYIPSLPKDEFLEGFATGVVADEVTDGGSF